MTLDSKWSDFKLDGLDEVECVLLIEEEFDVRLSDEEAFAIKDGTKAKSTLLNYEVRQNFRIRCE